MWPSAEPSVGSRRPMVRHRTRLRPGSAGRSLAEVFRGEAQPSGRFAGDRLAQPAPSREARPAPATATPRVPRPRPRRCRSDEDPRGGRRRPPGPGRGAWPQRPACLRAHPCGRASPRPRFRPRPARRGVAGNAWPPPGRDRPGRQATCAVPERAGEGSSGRVARAGARPTTARLGRDAVPASRAASGDVVAGRLRASSVAALAASSVANGPMVRASPRSSSSASSVANHRPPPSDSSVKRSSDER